MQTPLSTFFNALGEREEHSCLALGEQDSRIKPILPLLEIFSYHGNYNFPWEEFLSVFTLSDEDKSIRTRPLKYIEVTCEPESIEDQERPPSIEPDVLRKLLVLLVDIDYYFEGISEDGPFDLVARSLEKVEHGQHA
ncbi:hypothetical protein CVT26_013633 [Gymnopilus dilepis]|uniref:Uncharacterized protein n=1 Tax=Gymnopilus dilepis TaxID=231916 RepID=A0A409Y5L0_9AGAR|nr:hypothetical protein CVT26_013633 [Gymnopilus dilepis]